MWSSKIFILQAPRSCWTTRSLYVLVHGGENSQKDSVTLCNVFCHWLQSRNGCSRQRQLTKIHKELHSSRVGSTLGNPWKRLIPALFWLIGNKQGIRILGGRGGKEGGAWPLNASMYLQRASWFRVIRLGWPILPRLWMPWDAEQFEFKPAGRAPLWSWRPSTPTARWSFTRPPWKSVEKMKRRTFHDFMTPFHDSWCNLMQSDAKMICESLLELFAFYRRAVTLPRQKPWGISRISVAGYLSDVSEKTRAGAFEGHRRRLRKPSTR